MVDNLIFKNLITKKIMFFLYFFIGVLPKFIYNSLITYDQIYLYSYFDTFCHLIYFLKYSSLSMLNSLVDVVVIDRPSYGIKRFELHYVFWNKIYNCRIVIILFNDGFNPIISISGLYSSSNWLEREAWDMFGIKFLFHPNLRRILTDYNFKGHPLRKDFPLIGYVELIYNDSIHNIQVIPVEIMQNLRFFEFLNPWVKFKNYDDIR